MEVYLHCTSEIASCLEHVDEADVKLLWGNRRQRRYKGCCDQKNQAKNAQHKKAKHRHLA